MKTTLFSCHKKQGWLLMHLKRIICYIVFLALTSILMYNIQISPALVPFVKANATTEITLKLQQTIGKCVQSGKYSDFVVLNYGENGNVVSLETNMVNVSLLVAEITESAVTSLTKCNDLSVSVPIGNLTGGAIFAGKGPLINIKISVSPKINCRIENEFLENGINQTLHRIYAVVDTEVYALVPMKTQTISVSTKYCIAETVIVGDVPDAYTKINRLDDEISESDIDDIYDFGATLQ